MDKNVLKKFAIESRQELMDKISNKIKKFYVDEEFKVNQNGEVCVLSNEKHTLSLTKKEYENRQLLIKRINEITLEQVIEEAAYTWFNRIIAIRYMEIHDYLPLTKDNQSLGIRVLSSKDNTPDPEIMKISNLINPELDIEFNKEYYSTIQDNNKRFEYILLLVCRKLGKVIPQVFDGITDYIDILVPDNLLNDSGYITKVLKDVSEDNYEKVEIIGWLYQFYNQTEKDRVISAKKAYKKNEIPFATQLFTPDWIVKYMVENSLGKFWIEHGGNKSLLTKWKYYIENDDINIKENIDPINIKCIDPCSGSGHILIYMFEVLFQIYESYGYSKKEIPHLILENNIYGLDIDDRAGQLSILSIILKSREYDKTIFNNLSINNMNVLSFQESNNIDINSIKELLLDNSENTLNNELDYIIDSMVNAKEIGSLLILKQKHYDEIIKLINNLENKDLDIFGLEKKKYIKEKLLPLLKIAKILTRKYEVVVTNPPYLNNSLMSSNLKSYINKNYSNYKSDLFSAFFIQLFNLSKDNAYIGAISPYVWMFIKSYEDLRKYIIQNKQIESLIQLEYNSFEVACVPIATYVFKNQSSNHKGTYIRLSNFPGIDIQEEKTLNAIKHNNIEYKYIINQDIFKNIPTYIIGYWLNSNIIDTFMLKKAGDIGSSSKGIITGDNSRFLRLWHEVNYENINFKADTFEDSIHSPQKWYPCRKGGGSRKWYGNKEYLINWKNNGYEIMDCAKKESRNSQDYDNSNKFKKSICWTSITISNPTFRIDEHDLSESAGMSYFADINKIENILAIFNTNYTREILQLLSPTMNYTAGSINNIPIKEDLLTNQELKQLALECIEISKADWNSFETSWDFKKHPLIQDVQITIKENFDIWAKICQTRREELIKKEKCINDLVINSYGLSNFISNTVADKDIAIRTANKEREVKSLISYIVGCMFGRFTLNKNGLIYAGGIFNESEYKDIKPDSDNIIPITEFTYFNDDIVSKFKECLEIIYGAKNLYENIDFIADTLGKRNGESNEDTIKRYFINDFYNDHIKMYQKRPIYWLFDSGKKNGFKCLIYMHRYNKGTVSKVRLDYLHKMQNTYEKELNEIERKLSEDVSLMDKKELAKKQAEMIAKIQETKEYDEKIAHIADKAIEIDLDDGVAVNYAKFSVKNPKTGKEESILANSKDIAIKKKKEE